MHNCVHGNDPKRHERISRIEDLEELWAAVMRSIDELVHLVKPRKTVFLAVDGVAPRAKMNQQRARRFRSARDRALLKAQIEAQGKSMPDLFDTNAISPGTKFMSDLCKQLHFFVKYKVNTDPLYQKLESCVLSDGCVPGEGEHKMLDYIRQLRKKEDYDPNTRHCFYGADADLIMLSLLTHEPHFTIIREEHVVKRGKASGGVQRVELSTTNNFQLIHISLLREYFMLEYKSLQGKLRMRFDLERIIDDFVFFCFFIGNDFMPSLSALDIAEGSLDKLIDFYKNVLPTLDDYVTDSGVIHWDRAEKFIQLLGAHESEVFANRIDQIDHRRTKDRTVTVSQEVSQMMGSAADQSRRGDLAVFNVYKDQLFQKKKAKVEKLKVDNAGKRYKKHLIRKRFEEDGEGDGKRIPKQEKAALTKKLQALYATQLSTKQVQPTADGAEEAKSSNPSGVLAIVGELDAEYLSDLKPEDIPDDAVSDIEAPTDMQALEGLEEGTEAQKGNLMTAQADLDKKAEEDNIKFMQDFVTLYAADAKAARASYYKIKVGLDIDTPEGKQQQLKMLKKYLEGMQWVLHYYYRGAKHWRWYYPYHYAPLIGDLGNNIVRDFLGSKTVIQEFEVDWNCPEDNRPYTPFQQLLAIMPLKSFRLLPTCYEQIARGDLVDYFPEQFNLDLNGKTLAWEAICLIPFVEEALFLQKERELMASGATYSEEERLRNNWSFTFFAYRHDLRQNAGKQKKLKSTLTHLRDLDRDCSSLMLNSEYESVGTDSFKPMLLKGVELPCPGYASFKTLNAIDLEVDRVTVQKVSFEKFLVVIPQALEETQPEELEKYLLKLTKQNKKDVFIGYPYQHEAFPTCFEDMFNIYTLFGDYYENKFTVQKNPQFKTEDQWATLINRLRHNLREQGLYCPQDKVNVVVSCSKMAGVEFNNEFDNAYFYKTYDDKPTQLPFSLMIRRRHPNHYLNVDSRMAERGDDELKPKVPVVCLNLNMFGVLGTIEGQDRRRNIFRVSFDKQAEEGKVHDPFMGLNHMKELQETHKEQMQRATAYFGDQDIDLMLGCEPGITAYLTSSFMLKYKDRASGERVIVDIGLNVKSWAKKLHVPRYVRFVADAGKAVANQHDNMTYTTHNRGAKHVRSHWEYSIECVEILKEYQAKFPEVFAAATKGRKHNSMPDLKDLLGSNDEATVGRLKEILRWIEQLPISAMPFVEMGFDTLDPDLIESLNRRREQIQKEYPNVELKVKATEYMASKVLYAERFPYWCPLYSGNSADMFKAGQRVMNLNSCRRAYVPFGLRGTVVGKTEKKVIVLFDEQFLQGTDINGHCELYRGAVMDPSHLLNITKKFESQIRKHQNHDLVQAFTERPAG